MVLSVGGAVGCDAIICGNDGNGPVSSARGDTAPTDGTAGNGGNPMFVDGCVSLLVLVLKNNFVKFVFRFFFF